jgi:hypothetical protein
MKIIEFKAIIDALADLHPEARIDAVHPVRFRNAVTSRIAHITGYRIYGAGEPRPRVRLIFDHAREDYAEDAALSTAQQEK